VNDHFAWGADASKPLGQEAWFERRYPNLLEDSRVKMVDGVNNQCQDQWGNPSVPDLKQRINVVARDTAYLNADGTVRKVKKNDDRFTRGGDIPQTPWEADELIGAFSIDVETPIPVTYSSRTVSGRTLNHFEWTGVMYVEDVLGLQKENNIVHLLGDWTLKLAPSRRVKRARWPISGEGWSYVVAPGDSLSKIALDLTGDAKAWTKIYDANKSRIANPDRITPGQRIVIPAELVRP